MTQYRQCPALAYWSVVERETVLMPWRVTMGKLVHRVVELDGRSRIASHDPSRPGPHGGLTPEGVDEILEKHGEELRRETDWKDAREDDAEKFIPRAAALAHYYVQAIAPVIPLLDVERRVTIRWPDSNVAITGVVDQWMVDGVADLKTTSRAPPEGGQSGHRIQAALYGLAWRTMQENVPPIGRLDYLVLSETQRGGRQVRHLPVQMDPAEMEIEAATAISLIDMVAEGAARGDFRRDVSRCDDVYGRMCPHLARCQPWRATIAERKGAEDRHRANQVQRSLETMAEKPTTLPGDLTLEQQIGRALKLEVREVRSSAPMPDFFRIDDETNNGGPTR